MENTLPSKVEIEFRHYDLHLQIKSLCPFIEEEKPLTKEILEQILHDNNVIESCNLKILEWYFKKVTTLGEAIADVMLGHGSAPVREGSAYIKFENSEFSHDDATYWHFVQYLFKNLSEYDLNQPLPVTLLYVRKDETIGTLERETEDKDGLTIKKEVMPASQGFIKVINPGENVQFYEESNKFRATLDGYVVLVNGVISVYPPFYVTEDSMNLYFINYERSPHTLLKQSDVNDYKFCHKFSEAVTNHRFDPETPIGEPILLVSGKLPSEGTDATLEFYVEVDNKYIDIDENGQINYREVQKFPSVLENDLIVKKTKPIKGKDGHDLFGNVVQPRFPIDIILKNGSGTIKEENDTEVIMYAKNEGLINYSKDTISVSEKLQIKKISTTAPVMSIQK